MNHEGWPATAVALRVPRVGWGGAPVRRSLASLASHVGGCKMLKSNRTGRSRSKKQVFHFPVPLITKGITWTCERLSVMRVVYPVPVSTSNMLMYHVMYM